MNKATPTDYGPACGKSVSAKTLLHLLHLITDIPWEWHDCDKKVLGVEGTWQLMPATPQDECLFWYWHLACSRQWFDNPHEAVTNLLSAWFKYAETNRVLKRCDDLWKTIGGDEVYVSSGEPLVCWSEGMLVAACGKVFHDDDEQTPTDDDGCITCRCKICSELKALYVLAGIQSAP